MLQAAQALGAEVRTDELVTGWESQDERVYVDASTKLSTKSLVITAGPWSAECLKNIGVELTVTRQVQGWLAPPDPSAFLPAHFPCWGIDIGGGNLFYGFPALPNHRGQPEVKVARHARGPRCEPNSDCRKGRVTDADDFLPLLDQYLPGLAGTVVRTCTCLYTNSPDSHFIIDRYPRHPNVAFGTGFSGHGFKLAPAVGQILKDLVESKPPFHPEPFFGLSRLSGGGGPA
jgi:sarcosine oxidase